MLWHGCDMLRYGNVVRVRRDMGLICFDVHEWTWCVVIWCNRFDKDVICMTYKKDMLWYACDEYVVDVRCCNANISRYVKVRWRGIGVLFSVICYDMRWYGYCVWCIGVMWCDINVMWYESAWCGVILMRCDMKVMLVIWVWHVVIYVWYEGYECDVSDADVIYRDMNVMWY